MILFRMCFFVPSRTTRESPTTACVHMRFFLAGIARNVVIDAARKRARRDRREVAGDDSAAVDLSLQGAGPEAALLNAEERGLADAFLETLPDDERRFIAVRFVLERTQDVTAAELGISRQQVRTLEDKVRDHLRAFLRRRRLSSAEVGDKDQQPR